MRSGILLIDKPKGFTSRDVVNVISKKLGTKKIGHTGTLDPNATGLMIICINQATGLVDLITSEDKEYIATVKMGVLTDTLDIKGKIVEEDYNYNVKKIELINTLNSFIGKYYQEVPKYSAIKINGKKLYEYARCEKDIILPKRLVEIKEIELLSFNNEEFSFRVKVSKGTYIRSLVRDIGAKLNILMTLLDLRRTKIDKYDVSDALDIENFKEDDIINVADFLDFPQIKVDKILEKKVLNGVRIKNIYQSDYVMFFNELNELLAIYKNNDENDLCMYKLFYNKN